MPYSERLLADHFRLPRCNWVGQLLLPLLSLLAVECGVCKPVFLVLGVCMVYNVWAPWILGLALFVQVDVLLGLYLCFLVASGRCPSCCCCCPS